MATTIAHIAIAVKNLDEAKQLFARLLGARVHHEEEVPGQRVRTVMFRVGNVSIELLEGTSPDSPVSKFIDKRGEGVHHIALDVGDIEAEIGRLKKEGFELVDDRPQPGADNTVVAFLHPRSTNGVLIELSEQKQQRGG
jgi:methylmalonyl-CoA/ethylmalonyl-CoA epimerase